MTRIEIIRSTLGELELDALLLKNPVNRFYATGFSSSAGALVITREDACFFTDSRYFEAASAGIKDARVVLTSTANRENKLVSELLTACGCRRLGVEESFLSYSEYTKLEKELPPALVPAGKLLVSPRSRKDEAELDALRAAQRISERALDDVLGLLAPGMTERAVAAELIYRQLKYGAEAMAFDPIVVSGKNSSLPHGVPGDRVIKTGDFITMDFGCVKDGYCSDMTRTVAVGSADAEMREVYSVVLRAQLAGIEAARAGVPGSAVDGAARSVIESAGYGDFFGHGFGHGVGLEVHEAPNAAPSCGEPLPEGAVISAEPGIYLPGKFGVRIEDVLVLRAEGCENLTKAPKNLIVL